MNDPDGIMFLLVFAALGAAALGIAAFIERWQFVRQCQDDATPVFDPEADLEAKRAEARRWMEANNVNRIIGRMG